MKNNQLTLKNKIKTFGITNTNVKWNKDSKNKEYKQHDTIDDSEPSYPSDTYRPIISRKMRLEDERIYTPFFTLEFIIRYKDLFELCFDIDPNFKEYVEQNLGKNFKTNNLSKDELSLPLFNFYKENPSQLFSLIKKLRKKTEDNLLTKGIDHLCKKQLPLNHQKAEKDLDNRLNRIQKFYANKTHEEVQKTSKMLQIKREEEAQKKMQNQKTLDTQDSSEQSPSLVKMATNFASAMKDFAESGFLRVTNEQYKARMDICNKCEFWKSDARMGLGKCLKCGCTGAKQWIATSVCPIEKWGAVSKEEVEASKERENAQAQETQGTVSQQADGSTQEPSS